MMTSPKEQQRQQIYYSGILFIKGGWPVDKSNRPLWTGGGGGGGGGGGPPPPPPHTSHHLHDYQGQK